MDINYKRLLYLIGFGAAVLLLAYGIYYVFFKGPAQQVGPGGGTTTPGQAGQLPPSGERPTTTAGGEVGVGQLPPGGVTGQPTAPTGPSYYQQAPVTQLTSDYAQFESANQSGQINYYNGTDGKFYKIGADGKPVPLSDQVFYNVSNVTWANTANKAVLEYPDSSKIIYNFDTKTQVSLPKHWEEFSFSPDSTELAAKSMGLSPENRWLVVTQDDGTGTKLVEPLGDNANRVIVDWSPSRQTVALSQTGQPMGEDRREVLFVGLNGENFKSTVVEGLDFQPQWSPTGKRLLYSVDSARSDFKPELWVVDAYGDSIGNNRRLLKLNTWADKCTFGNDTTLYCAVPQSLPQGAGMNPDIANDTMDDLYKIDLTNGLQTSINTGGNYHINNLSYNAQTNKLFFTDPLKTGVFQVNP